MQPTRPSVTVPGDDAAKDQWRYGHIAGFSGNLVSWSFGFTPGSLDAKSFNLTVTGGKPVIVLANTNGQVTSKAGHKQALTVPARPFIAVPGDDANKTQWLNGYVVGYARRHVVWTFGFAAGSPLAKSSGLAITGGQPLWVLADVKGHVVATYTGSAQSLPKRFTRVLGPAPGRR